MTAAPSCWRESPGSGKAGSPRTPPTTPREPFHRRSGTLPGERRSAAALAVDSSPAATPHQFGAPVRRFRSGCPLPVLRPGDRATERTLPTVTAAHRAGRCSPGRRDVPAVAGFRHRPDLARAAGIDRRLPRRRIHRRRVANRATRNFRLSANRDIDLDRPGRRRRRRMVAAPPDLRTREDAG